MLNKRKSIIYSVVYRSDNLGLSLNLSNLTINYPLVDNHWIMIESIVLIPPISNWSYLLINPHRAAFLYYLRQMYETLSLAILVLVFIDHPWNSTLRYLHRLIHDSNSPPLLTLVIRAHGHLSVKLELIPKARVFHRERLSLEIWSNSGVLAVVRIVKLILHVLILKNGLLELILVEVQLTGEL